MELGNRFKSTKTGEIFTVAEINEKFNQIIIAGEDGKTKAYSATTLKDKRRFVPLIGDEKPVEEPEKTLSGKTNVKNEHKVPEDSAGAYVKEYIVEKAKEMGADVCENSSGKFISFKIGGKMFAAIFSWSKKGATLGTRSQALEGSGIECSKKMNHMMDYRFTFDSLFNTDEIDKILQLSKEYQLNKNK